MTSNLEKRLKRKISAEFRNTPIEGALMLMADQADVDIVKSPAVTGTVTVKFTDVPLKEALDNILAAHGYRYVADRNMIRVAPADEIEQMAERIISRIYRIRYADVKEVESALRKFISKQGSISSVPSKSNIIVTDTESQIKAIDEIIKEVDRVESAGAQPSKKQPTETKQDTKRIIIAILISLLIICVFVLSVWLIPFTPFTWLKNHPNSYGLQGSIIFLIPSLIVGLFKPQWRNWCWGTTFMAFLVLILSLLGGRSSQ